MAVTVPDSQANFLWIRAHEVPGDDLVARLEELARPGRRRRAARRRRLRARRDPRPPRRRPPAVGAARGAAGPGRGHAADEGARARGRGACARGAGRRAGRDEKPTGPQKLDLKIGNLLPLTGNLDPFGKPSQRAADVAAEEIRKAAAKAGARHTVRLQNVDYKSDPKTAVDARQRAREGRVHLPDRPLRLRARRAGRRQRQHAQAGPPDLAVGERRADLTTSRTRGYLNRVVPARHAAGGRARRAHVAKAEGRRQGQDGQHRHPRVDLRQGADEALRGGVARQGRHGRAQGHLPARLDDLHRAGRPARRGQARRVGVLRLRRHLREGRAGAADQTRRSGWTPRKTFATDSLANPRLPTSGPTSATGSAASRSRRPRRARPRRRSTRRSSASAGSTPPDVRRAGVRRGRALLPGGGRGRHDQRRAP